AGKADAGIAGITVTPEPKKNIGFTDSYADVLQVIMVNSNEVKAAGNQPGVIDKFKSCCIDDNRYQYLLQGLGNTLIITFFAII
ncbi:transporter substrate-binding domain-containing protein, partial [Escherichia coli]|nr:transporter substrate-binding domain-containing protein [Escherichia coli]